MNKLILELAEEAYEYSDIPNTDGVFNKEKFAELLFDEFCDVVIDCDENPKMILHEPYSTIIAKLTEHFYGVEK